MKKLNRKGFTLIELLGVIVVLVAIMLIAIPSISSTYEKNKQRIKEQKIDNIKSAAEIYASRYKKNFPYNSFLNGKCGVSVLKIKEEGLLTEEELIDIETNEEITIDTVSEKVSEIIVKYNKGDGTYSFAKDDDTSEFGCHKIGDFYQDGGYDGIDQNEANLLSEYIVGAATLSEKQKLLADVDGSGEVNVNDSTLLLKFLKYGVWE